MFLYSDLNLTFLYNEMFNSSMHSIYEQAQLVSKRSVSFTNISHWRKVGYWVAMGKVLGRPTSWKRKLVVSGRETGLEMGVVRRECPEKGFETLHHPKHYLFSICLIEGLRAVSNF